MYDAAPAAPRRLAFLRTTGGGVLCICLAAALWCAVLRCAIGRIQRAVLRSSWWPAGRAAQKEMLYDVGFARDGMNDEVAAAMFAWLGLAIVAQLVGGALTLPVVVLGWVDAGSFGRDSFLLGVLQFCGWTLFDVIDGTVRTWGRQQCPSSPSGLPFVRRAAPHRSHRRAAAPTPRHRHRTLTRPGRSPLDARARRRRAQSASGSRPPCSTTRFGSCSCCR